MSWIESHQELGRHPKLLKLASDLRIHKAQAVGHLKYLWWWALDFAPSGDLSALASAEISAAAEWPGDSDSFHNALKRAVWLDPDGKLHDWQHYAGPCLLGKERQRRYREKRLNLRASSNDVIDDGKTTSEMTTTIPNLTIPNHTIPEKKIARFTRPSASEVTEYAKSIGFLGLNSQRFCDYYESKGWLVGKAPMKSWKAAVRTWKLNSGGDMFGKAENKVGATGGFQQTKQPII